MKSIIVIFMLALTAGYAQNILGGSMVVHVDDFMSQGRAEDSGADWKLFGKSAEVSANITDVRSIKIQIKLKDGVAYNLSSHSARYVNALHEIKSSAPILLDSEGLKASGIGYDVFLDKKILRIRSNVKIDIERTRVKSLDEIIDKEKEQ